MAPELGLKPEGGLINGSFYQGNLTLVDLRYLKIALDKMYQKKKKKGSCSELLKTVNALKLKT